MILQCYIDDRTLAILKRVSEQTGRTIEDLAEAAISDAASGADRDQPQPKDHP